MAITTKVKVPLTKVHAWIAHCSCGGNTEIAAGVIGHIDGNTVYCSNCKAGLEINERTTSPRKDQSSLRGRIPYS